MVVLISSLNLKVSNIVMTKTSFQMLEVLSFCDLNLLEEQLSCELFDEEKTMQ